MSSTKEKYMVVSGEFSVNFTTRDLKAGGSVSNLRNDIEGLFASTLDAYLNENDIKCEEVHFVFCDHFSIDEVEDD